MSGNNGVLMMDQMDWMKLEYKRRVRQAAWFFFILGAIFGFIFGLMADGAHAAYNNETPFAIDWQNIDDFWTR